MGRLFHRELVTISPLDRSAQRVDGLRSEPYGHLARAASVELYGQVDEDRRETGQAGPGGLELQEGGSITFRLADVTASGWTPTRGDEVTTITDRAGNARSVRWYVLEAHRSGKRPRSRTADLVVVRWSTRSPARQAERGV